METGPKSQKFLQMELKDIRKAHRYLQLFMPTSLFQFYWNHIATTLSEWILALLIEAFIVSYTYDLALTCLESPTARTHELLNHNDHSHADMVKTDVKLNIAAFRSSTRIK